MKKNVLYFVSVLFLCIITILARAVKPPTVRWVVKNPFEQKAFIENKGQYNLPGKAESKNIFYGARQNGLQYYFTAEGIWIGLLAPVKSTEEEIEELKRRAEGEEKKPTEEEDDKEFQYKLVEQFHYINFINSDKDCHIEATSPISQYYNFEIAPKTPVVAHAYKLIRYINLYPGIDMEVYFPENKQGFEYSFIVHPGADISQIKIRHQADEKTNLSEDGNIHIKSSYGEFIDHVPVAYIQDSNQRVNCTYTLTQGLEGFKTGSYDTKSDLIIDPWVTTPQLNLANYAYDVDWDNAGNSYIYGGGIPWQIEKFDASGKQLWAFTPDFANSVRPCYGDFAVDRFSQSVYIVEGWDPAFGAQIIKLNSSGSQVKIYAINPKFNEMWRIAFSHCTDEAVIGAGGTAATLQACSLDTNLANMTPVNVLRATYYYHDIWGLALDNYGYCYMSPARAGLGTYNSTVANNTLLKVPVPALAPLVWTVPSGYHFREVNSVGYNYNYGNPANSEDPNGYNGMTVSDTNLYTYDTNALKQWSTNTGTLKNRIYISKLAPDSLLRWGGLTSDECDNIFAGSANQIFQYDAALTKLHTIDAADTVYDVSVGPGNTLYACGKNFVEAITVTLNSCYNLKVSNFINNDSCIVPGSAIISLSGGGGPYEVSWNTTPVQNGDTATNLLPGQYIATIIDQPGACFPYISYDTIQILQKTLQSPLSTNNLSMCYGDSSVLNVSGAVSYVWSPSTGLSATTGDSIIAKPMVTTTYTVIGTNNLGCLDTNSAAVIVNPLPLVSITPQSPVYCIGENVTLMANGAKNYNWSPSEGLNTTTGSNVTADPMSKTIYSVTGIDSLGCVNTGVDTVNVDSLPNVSFSIQPPGDCNTQQIQFTNTSLGGSTYLWSFGDGTTDNSFNPLHSYSKAGVYSVKLIVTSKGGCSDSIIVTDSVKSVNYGLHIGNAFLPSDIEDGNNIFKPEQILCSANLNYIFRVYSRWGELLYETNDPNQGWDGTYKGRIEPVDVYVYYIQYNCGPCSQFIKGNVTLLR